MDELIIETIKHDFKSEDVEIVINELSSIGLNHVMAQSEYNLRNTRFAILKLAKGNLEEVINLTEAAKSDFRDVIYWATLERE